MQRKAAETARAQAPRARPSGPDPLQARADLHGGVLDEDAQLAWALQARPHLCLGARI